MISLSLPRADHRKKYVIRVIIEEVVDNHGDIDYCGEVHGYDVKGLFSTKEEAMIVMDSMICTNVVLKVNKDGKPISFTSNHQNIEVQVVPES